MVVSGLTFWFLCSQLTEEYGARDVCKVQKSLLGASKNYFSAASHFVLSFSVGERKWFCYINEAFARSDST